MTTSAPMNTRKRKNLTPSERAEVIAFLLKVSIELEPPIGAIAACSTKYECSDDQIARLWRRALQDIKSGNAINYDSGRKGKSGNAINYDSGRKGKSGRKTRLTEEFRHDLSHAIELTLFEERTNIRTLASSLGIAKSSLHDYFLAGAFRRHTTRLKPLLSDQHRADRLKFAYGFVHRGPRNTRVFDSFMNYVHLDEKWFYLKKENQRFYLGTHEEPPHLTVKNKNYIVKVMFLVAVARPRWD
ncbi:hypothetical protein F441_10433, partial [Phytophthora nicotianae CJ01A1]